MVPKNRIHLSRQLFVQTTPYPNAHKWLLRAGLLLIIFLASSVYLLTRVQEKTNPGPLPKQILGETTEDQTSAPEYVYYVVKKNDTLFNLSQKVNVSWQTIATLNNLEEPYLLKIGQKLKIPNVD